MTELTPIRYTVVICHRDGSVYTVPGLIAGRVVELVGYVLHSPLTAVCQRVTIHSDGPTRD